MESQKINQYRGSSYSDKNMSRKKKTNKEGDNNKGIVTMVETTMAALATEEKPRYQDVSYSENTNKNIDINNNYYYNYNNNYNNSTLEINAIVMGSNHNHENEDWRAWVKPCTLVDEQMSWGSTWYSFWEGDANNSNEFYSDVVEDDLWGFKTIQHPPP